MSSRCLLSMLLGFPFLAFRIFHNKLVFDEKSWRFHLLRSSALCFLDFTFFVLFFFVGGSSSSNLAKDCIADSSCRYNVRSNQKFLTFALYLWITITKNFMKKNWSGKQVKRGLLDGVDNFRLVQRQMKVSKANYKLCRSQKIN